MAQSGDYIKSYGSLYDNIIRHVDEILISGTKLRNRILEVLLLRSSCSVIICPLGWSVMKYATSEFAQKRIEPILCCMRIGADEIAENERTKIRRIP
ncbi:hypothetical protein CDAR_18721 [Caerostris darwini]|uniref:Uncharacterized protein n=1 Tax=Caerostris darwini TaxID=1538125 RepID=A0AAV4T0R1_9ARAC|nr:hypothetical protein CDAR_18721 [Caerostris darwini]